MYLDFAVKLASQVGFELRKKFRSELPQTRGFNKTVKSKHDIFADELIKNRIKEFYPNHSILTEETGYIDKKSEYLWVIDPLDGTRNFVNGNPFFAVSIALWKNQKPLIAVIEAPLLLERFTAEYGKGAIHYDLLHNAHKAASVSDISDSKVSYGLYCAGGVQRQEKILKIYQKTLPESFDLRKLGSAALELAWVGVGRADRYFTPSINFWDIAAGLLLVHESGGRILDFSGNPYQWDAFFAKDKFDLQILNSKINPLNVYE